MEELLARLTNAAKITEDAAKKAVGIIFGFIEKESSQAAAAISAIPGVDDLVAAAAAAAQSSQGILGRIGGMFGGAGGDVMQALDRLSNEAGLTPDQIETVGKEIFAFMRAKLGDDAVNKIVAAIPGLSRFS